MRSEIVPVLIAELQRPELIIHESGEQLAVNSQKKLAAEIVQQRADDTRRRAKAAAWLFRLGKAEFVWPLLAANSVFLASGRASALRVQDRIFNAPAESPENGVVVSLTRSAVVVLPVPIYEFLHAFFDRCAGPETDVALKRIDVSECGRNVTRLHGEHIFLRFATKRLLERLNQVHEFDRLIVADVVNAVRCGRLRIVSSGRNRLSGRDRVIGPNHAFDNISYKREITFHLPVVEDIDWLAAQNGFGENPYGHVRSSPGAVDREESQPRRRNSIQMAIGMRHQFIGFFCRGIQAYRMIHSIIH